MSEEEIQKCIGLVRENAASELRRLGLEEYIKDVKVSVKQNHFDPIYEIQHGVTVFWKVTVPDDEDEEVST